jgi:hypothetical protein
MSTIFMDPTEMRGTAGMVGEQAQRIQETVTGTRTACTCEVPRSLVGWLDAELVAITESALQVAVDYLTEAVDLARRAQEIEADQSLATTCCGPLAPTTDLTSAVVGGTVVGGTISGFGAPATTFAGVPGTTAADRATTDRMINDMLIGMMGPSLADVMGNQGDGIRTILAPPGLVYNNGAYEDYGGDRSTSLSGEYQDPDTGRYDLD